MKLAAAAYRMDFLDSWDAYVAKLTAWVEDAAGQGADLLVFPEYGAMEPPCAEALRRCRLRF